MCPCEVNKLWATLGGLAAAFAVAGGLYTASTLIVWAADYQQDKIRTDLRWNGYETLRLRDQYFQLQDRELTDTEKRWLGDVKLQLRDLRDERKALEERRTKGE